MAGDREAIRDKIATRATLIAGRDDDERTEINAFVKKAYDARSAVAHGGKKTGNIDLRKLRDISRRVIVVLLAVARRCRDQGEFAEIIRGIPINQATQDALAKDRDEVFPLVKAIETRI